MSGRLVWLVLGGLLAGLAGLGVGWLSRPKLELEAQHAAAVGPRPPRLAAQAALRPVGDPPPYVIGTDNLRSQASEAGLEPIALERVDAFEATEPPAAAAPAAPPAVAEPATPIPADPPPQ